MALTADDYWSLIHAERARVADVLTGLSTDQWQAQSLCAEWTVEDTTAHITAAARTGLASWVWSMLRAGFNPAKHNARKIRRYRGETPEETLATYRSAIQSAVSPTKDFAAFLGEVIVHGQDIARPLGVTLTPDHAAVREVASFFAAKDFAVNSKSLIKGLSLQASDDDFATGSGPTVEGRLLDLVMAMAGRTETLTRLTGHGVEELSQRLAAHGRT